MHGSARIGSPEKTILIVDDEPAIVDFVSLVLQESGFITIAADSGESALKTCRDRKKPIHMLISDVHMKGISGLELAENVSVKWPGIKVVLISGFADKRSIHNNAWHFLSKPFAPSQLTHMVSQMFEAEQC